MHNYPAKSATKIEWSMPSAQLTDSGPDVTSIYECDIWHLSHALATIFMYTLHHSGKYVPDHSFPYAIIVL